MKKTLIQVALTIVFFAFRVVQADGPSKSVLFVCEHGSAKSLMAASFFDRLAAEQNVAYRAIARGTTPEETVPPGVAADLKKDGFELAFFKPQILTRQDVDQAVAIVAFCEIPPGLVDRSKLSTWMDVPPASVDYEKAKAVMLPRIQALVAELRDK